MGQYFNLEHLKFLMYEVHQLDSLFSLDKYKDFDKESIDLLVSTTKDWADKEFYPYFKEMDEKPAYFKDGRVITHPQINNIYRHVGENGYLGLYFDYEHGGNQVPNSIVVCLAHILQSANNHIPGYLGLNAGSAHLITSFGSQQLIDQFVPNMLNGNWGGTMCLTEPQAGSSLSDVKTMAYLNEDGTYKIKGQKIFISGGDHSACDNFVHLTLARIEGAPLGTKGISLFAIPRERTNADGTSKFNDVITAGDFQKMGQKGYSTTHLVFGENDDCIGWIVGEPHQGLKYMFQMMNGARIDVGMTAVSIATAAYYASLQYAKERPQGRRIESNGRKNPNQEPCLIIEHADVRRMLLKQKSIVEGCLSLLVETAKLVDESKALTGHEKENAHLLLELLTPMAKAYPSEKCKEAIDNGVQVLGGYGFCTDFVLQQYYRDVRITSLYEGTTGIQSLDLLGRKIPMQNGVAMQMLLARVTEAIQNANAHDELKPYATILSDKINAIQKVLGKLLPLAMQGEYELFLADATIFLEMMSTVMVAYQWLKMATVAKQTLLNSNGGGSVDFYESKIHTMKYFFKYELPEVNACLETLMSEDVLTVLKDEETDIFA